MLSLYKLEIFSLVVEEGSLSGAAERLLMSHAAVSQHIKDLEATLGVKLFERGRRGVTLTASGEKLHHHTVDILRKVAEAESDVVQVENLQTGQLSISATPGVSLYFFHDWAQAFRERLPQINVSLETGTTDTVVRDVLRRKSALGFTEGEISEGSASVGRVPLAAIEQYFIIGTQHAWRSRDSVRVDELAGQRLITRQPNSQTRMWLDDVLAAADVPLTVVGEFDNPESIKRAVMVSDNCATVLPLYAVENEVLTGRLLAIPFEGTLCRDLSLVYHADRPLSPLARAFVDVLRDVYPSLDGVL